MSIDGFIAALEARRDNLETKIKNETGRIMKKVLQEELDMVNKSIRKAMRRGIS